MFRRFSRSGSSLYGLVGSRFELGQRLLLIATPHTSRYNTWYPTFGADSIAEMAAAVGAVREDLARIFGQGIGAGPAIVDISLGDGNFFNKCRIGIGSNVCFEAMNGGLSLVFDPACVDIFLTCRRNNCCIDQCASLDCNRFGFELSSYCLEQQAIQTLRHQNFAKAHKGGAFWRSLITREAAKRRNDARSLGSLNQASTRTSFTTHAQVS